MPNLNAKITADARHFNKTMNKVKGRTRSIGRSFAGLGATIGAALSIRAISGFITKLDDIGKHAKRMQITTDEFQQLSFAAERGGADITAFETAFKKMNKTINDVKRGLSTAKMAFNELGISIDDLEGKSQVEKMMIITNALNLMEDQTRKSALATEILARSGLNLLPVIGDLKERMQEAKDIGLIDADTIKSAEELKDSFTKIKQSLSALVADSGVFQKMNEGLKELLATIKDMKEGEKILEKLEKAGKVKKRYEQVGTRRIFSPVGGSYAVPIMKEVYDFEATRGTEELKNFIKKRKKLVVKADQDIQKNKEIKAKQKAVISDVETKKAATEEKKLSSLKLQNALLNAQKTLSEDNYKRKKLELEMLDKINKAETEKAKTLLKQQYILKKQLLEKELTGKDVKEKDIKDIGGVDKNVASDRIKRIGGIIGGESAGGLKIESPSDKKRNKLLIDNNIKLDKITDAVKDTGGLA